MITHRFLRAKHWQLFLLMFGILFLLYTFLFVTAVFYFGDKGPTEGMVPTLGLRFMALIIFLFLGIYLGWLWSIAIGLQKYVPKEVHMKVTKFKVLFFSLCVRYGVLHWLWHERIFC